MPPPNRTAPGHFHFYAYDNDAANPWTLGSAQAQRGGLRFYSMVKDLTALQVWGAAQGVPNIAVGNAGAGIRINNSTRFTKVLSFGGAVANSPAVIITGGIHAREWVAPAMAYLLAEYLIKGWAAPASRYRTALRALINKRRIHIVPMLNPHGNSFTVYDPAVASRLWRPNRRRLPTTAPGWLAALTTLGAPNPPLQNVNVPAPVPPNLARYDIPVYRGAGATRAIDVPGGALIGVDLNRNCTTPAWGQHTRGGDTGEPGEEDYFGTRAGSERETQNIEAHAAAVAAAGIGAAAGVATAIDYHSYAKLVLYPTEIADGGGVNANYSNLGQILQVLIRPQTEGWFYDYQLGTPRQLLNYDGVGTLGDRIGLSHNARAFVIELDPGKRDPIGFELPENQIQAVFEKNIRGALALISAAGRISTVNNTRNWCLFKRRSINSNEQQFLGWNVYGRGNQLP